MPSRRDYERRIPGIGRRLKHLLHKHRLTVNQAANELGVHRNTLSAILNDDVDPRGWMLLKLAERFDISVDWLLGRAANGIGVW